jgi:hypothetical protein
VGCASNPIRRCPANNNKLVLVLVPSEQQQQHLIRLLHHDHNHAPTTHRPSDRFADP